MASWQEEAWRYYDSVGEFRFGIGWTSNALSRVNLVAARPPKRVGDEPSAIDATPDAIASDNPPTPAEIRATELVQFIAGGASGQGQLLHEFGQHLGVAGFGWLLAEPRLDDANADVYETWSVIAQDSIRFTSAGGAKDDIIEVRAGGGSGADAWRTVHPNALLVKTWRKHPRAWWEPDAPVRAVLGVLDIIELLTAHIQATGRSRLAGAGLLAIPQETEFPPPPPPEGDDPSTEERDGFDYFVDQLTDAMTIPIADRNSAAGVVPLTVAIPGEFIDKIQHISFATPFDDRVSDLLQESIKRLALGMDMPPEVLTGMAGVNHWTAWQVEATAITLHVEPNAEIVCRALTEGWLAPALAAEGHDPNAAMVWYDTQDLTSPPDKSGSAFQAYDRLQLSASALRRETGFVEEDAPNEDEFKQRVLLDAAKGAPTLAPSMLAKAGILPEEVANAVAPEAPQDAPVGDLTGAPADSGASGPPDAAGRPNGDRQAAHIDAVLMACDGIVYRALERAGTRLRSALGKNAGGPQAVEVNVDIASIHTVYDPTAYADLDHLLDGAFTRVPAVAEQLGLDPTALEATLRAYCRGLLAAQHDHDPLRLSSALGADATF